MAIYVGADFRLESVTQVAPATVRVKFAQDPKVVNPTLANDALNPSNYSLSGPAINVITGVGVVFGDPQSVDLFLTAPLLVGAWTLTVSTTLQSHDTSEAILPPLSLVFLVSSLAVQEPVAAGASNDNAEAVFRKHFNSALKGPAWEAVIHALSTGDQYNWDTAKLGFDQLFDISASGLYLDRLATDDGFSRPADMGLSDDLFRKLKIKVTNKKLVHEALLEVLEIFYGPESSRAFVTTGTSEPFRLEDQDDLDILFDENTFTKILFNSANFTQITGVTALELAVTLTRNFHNAGIHAYAAPITDPDTNLRYVRVYAPSLGLGSAIRITGGKANSSLQFEQLILTSDSTASWTVTVDLVNRTSTYTSNNVPTALELVRVGDYANVYGVNFLPQNRGSFPIIDLSITYPASVRTISFTVNNELAAAQVGATTPESEDLLFFRPTKETIHTTDIHAVIVSQASGLKVRIPATTVVVERTPTKAAYMHSQDAEAISSIIRRGTGDTVVTLPVATALQVGDQVFVDGAFPKYDSLSVGFTSGDSTHSDSALVSIWSQTGTRAARRLHTNTLLSDGRVFVYGGEAAGSVLNTYDVFATSGTTILGTGATRHTYSWTAGVGPAVKEWHSATLMPLSGNVYVYGGFILTTGAVSVANSQVYDPLANTFTAGANGVTRAAHGATIMGFDDNVLLTGGVSSTGTSLSSAEYYSEVTKVVTPASSMSHARVQHEQVHLLDGRVLVIGGRSLVGGIFRYTDTSNMGEILNGTEIYNPGTDTWVAAGNMTYSRFASASVLLNDGRVLVIGGWGYNPTQGLTPIQLNTCEIYDPASNFWMPCGKLKVAREYPAAVYLPDLNKVYVVGDVQTTTEYLDLVDLTWKQSIASLPFTLDQAKAVPVGNTMLLTGGFKGVLSNDTNQWLIPATEQVGAGNLNGLHRVKTLNSSTSIVLDSDPDFSGDFTQSILGSLTPTAAEISTIPGPYVLDPHSLIPITDVNTTLNQDIAPNGSYSELTVADTSGFDVNGGYLVIGYGTKDQIGPIKYTGIFTSTAIQLDASFIFPERINSGAVVTWLIGKSPFNPKNPEDLGLFYITASTSGRVAAEKTVHDIAGAGIDLELTVAYPGDRGLGAEGYPVSGTKISDKVAVWAGNDVDDEVSKARS